MLTKDVLSVIKKEALENNLEPALLMAVVDVESGGVAFWNIDGTDHPVIRFEGHYFYARLKGDKLNKAIKEGLASKKAGGVANPLQGAARYELLGRAELLDKEAAYESTSWGLGQVMGANYSDLGYEDVFDLVSHAQTLDGQVDMIIRFLKVHNLITVLQKKNWTKFASGYNGANYKANKYNTKLAAAYKKYSTAVDQTAPQDDIALVQRMLNTVGNYKLDQDGQLGPATRTALRDFQLKNNLAVDGLYGPLTREALERSYKAKSTQAKTNIAAGGIGLGVVGTSLTEAAKNIQEFASNSQVIQVLFIALLLIGTFLTLKYTLFRSSTT